MQWIILVAIFICIVGGVSCKPKKDYNGDLTIEEMMLMDELEEEE